MTFFTFASAVVAFFTAVSLAQAGLPRHHLLATAFAVMGSLFIVYGIRYAAKWGVRPSPIICTSCQQLIKSIGNRLNSMVTALEQLQEMSPINGNIVQELPTGKGSYVLLLHLVEPAEIQVGRLGQWHFAAGYYLYLGSALGSGGLAARLRHHLSEAARPFWHIDYLRQQAMVTAVWYQVDPTRRECIWATAVREWPGATIPVPGFGASDCRCGAHLVYFRERPLTPP